MKKIILENNINNLKMMNSLLGNYNKSIKNFLISMMKPLNDIRKTINLGFKNLLKKNIIKKIQIYQIKLMKVILKKCIKIIDTFIKFIKISINL